ncbi:elongation factor 2-like [Phragmites australis]|uniref:elongation factor 2-like n=1 Tax=Phragmites australis TaxID=29695 RepID=UPI002D76F4DD|nr:elongation factor 2-like [Phragmites australis]
MESGSAASTDTGKHVIPGKGELHLEICLNDLQLLHIEAWPLEKDLAKAIDNKLIGSKDEVKVHAKVLFKEFGWDKDLAKKIWCFGHEATGSNIFMDMCKGVQYVGEIRTRWSLASSWPPRRVCTLKRACMVSDLCSAMS